MKEQIRLLLSLHEEDQKIRELQAALERFAPELAEQEALVKGNQKTLDEANAKIAELEKAKRSKEADVETSEARQKDFQGKLSLIKTNKEYQAALKEISETKKNNKAIEDQILELMKQIEALKAEQQAAAEALKGASEVCEKTTGTFASEAGRIRREIETLQADRDRIGAQVQPGLISQYQRVRKSGKESLAQVVGGTCQGCYMKIPPQLYIELQKLTTIHVCPSCHRILYLAEWAVPKEGSNVPKEVSA